MQLVEVAQGSVFGEFWGSFLFQNKEGYQQIERLLWRQEVKMAWGPHAGHFCFSLQYLHLQNEEKQLEKGNKLLQRAYYVSGTVLVYYLNLASLTLILTLNIEVEIRVQKFIKHI